MESKESAVEEGLRKILENIPPNKTHEVVIRPNPPKELEYNLNEKGILRRNPNESQIDYNNRLDEFLQTLIKPITEYLDRIQTQYKPLPSIGLVTATMKAEDIHALGEKSYVKSITDGEILFYVAD